MKMKEFGPKGTRVLGTPLDLLMTLESKFIGGTNLRGTHKMNHLLIVEMHCFLSYFKCEISTR